MTPNELAALSHSEQLEQLVHLLSEGCDKSYLAIAVKCLESESVENSAKVALGEQLSKIGDPRLSSPSDGDYWVLVERKGVQLYIAKYMVTTAEWCEFLNSDAYGDDDHWCAAGLKWRNSSRPTWNDLASGEGAQVLTHANQPVVGVSWYEAQAYARAHGARLLESGERLLLVRGPEKRPYPWGDPFGRGNANTHEESLRRPCAVGIYSRDSVPEGVYDLAGNVAEWTSTGFESKKAYHPGSWKQPSMAAWAKAIQLISPAARSDELGFRLAKAPN